MNDFETNFSSEKQGVIFTYAFLAYVLKYKPRIMNTYQCYCVSVVFFL